MNRLLHMSILHVLISLGAILDLRSGRKVKDNGHMRKLETNRTPSDKLETSAGFTLGTDEKEEEEKVMEVEDWEDEKGRDESEEEEDEGNEEEVEVKDQEEAEEDVEEEIEVENGEEAFEEDEEVEEEDKEEELEDEVEATSDVQEAFSRKKKNNPFEIFGFQSHSHNDLKCYDHWTVSERHHIHDTNEMGSTIFRSLII